MPTRRAALAAAAMVLAPGRLRAQGPADPMQPFFEHGRYLPRYAAGPSAPGYAFDQFASFVGDERAALVYAAPRDGAAVTTVLGPEARAEDAVERIVSASAGRRVVMLNEAHVASRHRSFLARVLRALRPQGFTHLAAETFSNYASVSPAAPDISRFRSGGRFDPDFGFYTRDPVFAEAVREAAALGYGFLAYEARQDQGGPAGEEAQAAMRRREQVQADNFLAALKTLPAGARVLVFVGYGHLQEGEGVPAFAARLRADSGIDPLTIEQSLVGSFGPHARDSPLARAVLARFRPSAPIVVQDGATVVGTETLGTDLAVFHPSLADVEGRPGWLATDPARRLVHVPIGRARLRGLTLAQAVHAGERDPAVPADQYRLPYGAREAVFLLRPGRYRVRLETVDGLQAVGPLVV